MKLRLHNIGLDIQYTDIFQLILVNCQCSYGFIRFNCKEPQLSPAMQITYYLPTLVAMVHRQTQTENAFKVHSQGAQLERYLVASSCCV